MTFNITETQTSSNLDVTLFLKNVRRRVELGSVIYVKPILPTRPLIWHLWGGGNISVYKDCTQQLWQTVNTSPQMVCSLSEFQRQQGSLHIEQEELLFQLCCSTLDKDERMSLFILSATTCFRLILLIYYVSLNCREQICEITWLPHGAAGNSKCEWVECLRNAPGFGNMVWSLKMDRWLRCYQPSQVSNIWWRSVW